MVKDYLTHTRDELLGNREKLLKEISSYENRIKENIQMVRVLEDGSDPTYEAFTPREVGGFQKEKIAELLAEQESLTEQVIALRGELDELDYNIEQVTSVLRVAKANMIPAPDFSEDGDLSPEMKMALLQTVEKDRLRIARDLHDMTVQDLTSLVHKAELCTKLLDVDPTRCKAELYSIGKILREVIADTRRAIYDLRPMSFDDIGFEETIEQAIAKLNREDNITCTYRAKGTPFAIDSVIQISILRLIQEACSNAVRHSEATRFDVTLTYRDGGILLRIEDDGKGFDGDGDQKLNHDSNSGHGLSMMRERVSLLSGTMTVTTSPGEGCVIEITIPSAKEEN